MPVNTRGVGGRIFNEGIMAEAKFGGDPDRAIAQGILSTDALVADTLLGAKALELAEFRQRRRSGVKRGTCVDCGSEIPQARLKAVPFASRCVSCQEAVEPPA
jgi:phage/conjugal plasmid C-4 type zinc finger TraR family protein